MAAGIGTLVLRPEDWLAALGLLVVGGLVGLWAWTSIAKNPPRSDRARLAVNKPSGPSNHDAQH